MPTEAIHLVGAGGHARVVVDALLRLGVARAQISLWSEAEKQVGTEFAGFRIGRLDDNSLSGEAFHLCIGNNEVRARLHATLVAAGGLARTIVHPSAILALDASVGPGAFVAAGAIVGPNSIIGAACIINHGAIIDHDCIVDDFAHIGPGATLAGAVQIGRGVLIGAGANLLPSVDVKEHSTVGAGAVVTAGVPAATVVVGVPARRVR